VVRLHWTPGWSLQLPLRQGPSLFPQDAGRKVQCPYDNRNARVSIASARRGRAKHSPACFTRCAKAIRWGIGAPPMDAGFSDGSCAGAAKRPKPIVIPVCAGDRHLQLDKAVRTMLAWYLEGSLSHGAPAALSRAKPQANPGKVPTHEPKRSRTCAPKKFAAPIPYGRVGGAKRKACRITEDSGVDLLKGGRPGLGANTARRAA